MTPRAPDLVLASHVRSCKTRILVLHRLGIVVAAPFCFSSHNTAVSQLRRVQTSISSSRSRQPLTPVFAHVLLAQSDAPALRHSVRLATHSSPTPLLSNRASPHPATVRQQHLCQSNQTSPRATAANVRSFASITHEPDPDLVTLHPLLLPLPPLLPLPLCCYCSVTAVCWFPLLSSSVHPLH